MKYFKFLLSALFLVAGLAAFSQANTKDAITSEWETISMGKLQKKPVFKEPMISVRFISEEGARFMHLSLKYMFTDAVFEEAVPVEYYKNEKIEFVADRAKHELKAVRYSKARRMSTVAQKTADIKVFFSGDLSFLSTDPVKSFTVHYAQGYQNIKLNAEEAIHLREAYGRFLSLLPKAAPISQQNVRIDGEKSPVKSDTIRSTQNSLDELRQRAKQWRQ